MNQEITALTILGTSSAINEIELDTQFAITP